MEDAFQKLTWTDDETGITMGYRLFVPADYTPATSWPLVLLLHGAGESGSDNEAQIVSYQGATVWAKPAEQARHPCFVLAPKNPKVHGAFTLSPYGNRGWTSLLSRGFGSPYHGEAPLAAAYNLLRKVMGEYSIDADRLYATGLSTGGFGVFALGATHPDAFAGIVSVCGGLDPALHRAPEWDPLHRLLGPQLLGACLCRCRDAGLAVRPAQGHPLAARFAAICSQETTFQNAVT
ncbi:MAG: alpha/beta hydrolase-fold protein [Spirochaetia bacterium]